MLMKAFGIIEVSENVLLTELRKVFITVKSVIMVNDVQFSPGDEHIGVAVPSVCVSEPPVKKRMRWDNSLSNRFGKAEAREKMEAFVIAREANTGLVPMPLQMLLEFHRASSSLARR